MSLKEIKITKLKEKNQILEEELDEKKENDMRVQ